MVPNYLVLKQFHLLNTHLAVILPGIFSAFPVFIMTKFFASIPTPLIEAARLDGASDFYIFEGGYTSGTARNHFHAGAGIPGILECH